MNYSRLFTDPTATLVVDASVLINLNGSREAERILSSIPHQIAITAQAKHELEIERSYGRDDADKLEMLIAKKLITPLVLGAVGQAEYQALITGSAVQTLDDGEAATIALSVELGGIALIDERKAVNLCALRYPELEIASSLALFLHEQIASQIGRDAQAEAVFTALTVSKMRVPIALRESVGELIGLDRVNLCRSLSR